MNTTQEREKLRKQRQKERKRKKRRKNFLAFLTILIIALAAFIITIKVCNPDFDFTTLIPREQTQQVVAYINENVLGKTTTTEPTTTTTTTTKPTTTAKPFSEVDYDYDEFSEFDFNTALQGNQIGNLLNKSNGTVTYSSSFVYYSIPDKGIYKFEPTGESNSKLIVDKYNFICLNVLNDYLYAIDKNDNKLYRIAVASGDKMSIADNMQLVYLYNDKLYFVSKDNELGFIDTSSLEKTVLYKSTDDKKILFSGISLSRVFFVLYDDYGSTYSEYVTISIKDKSDRKHFMKDSSKGEIKNLQFEGGYMYYYQKQSDDSYNLCRQKFGSDKIVTLLEKCSLTDYPVICSNRLYYTAIDDDKVVAKELNMNSDDKKTMVSVKGADENGSMAVGFGYQYIFLTGCKSGVDGKPNDDFTFKGSCIYTSASGDNTLTFKDGKLAY